MLRIIFISIIILVGIFYAFISPFYALLFYLWNAYFRPQEWIWWVDIASWHISLTIGVYVVFRTIFSLPNPQISLRTALIWLFLLQAVIGTITSEHADHSLLYLEDYWKVLLISYFIVILVTDRHRFRTTMIIIVLSLGLECAKQGWVNLFIAPGAPNSNPIGFLGDNNGVALGTMMLVPLIAALARTTDKPWRRRAFWFIAIGVFMRGITTYSRGGFVAAAVLGLFTFARSDKKIRALIAVAALAGFVALVMPHEYWDRINTITTNEQNMDESAAGRVHFWRVAVDMARARPLTGVGLNGFEPSYVTYDPNSSFGEDRQTHSTWFGVLAELGLPGLALFLANLGLAIASNWRVARLARIHPDLRDVSMYANAFFTSLIVFCVGGSFLSSQYSEMYWHFIGLSAALSIIAAKEVEAKVPVPVPAQMPQRLAMAR
jgi:probable O-glycosylation ligase (exosortase A-associated)